jgi:orotate phosphoribosyltransferase
MPTNEIFKIPSKRKNLFLRVTRGHFATSHSHTNYYIDITTQKMRLSEAKAVAQELLPYYNSSTIVDTILCLDGTEVIGTCLAHELTRSGYMNMNEHQTIYVLTPERTAGSQLVLRDNMVPMVQGKHVLILAASVVTGYTALGAMQAVDYYGGHVVGVSSIFATTEQVGGYTVRSCFNPNDLPDYSHHLAHECPQCKAGKKLDALINGFGYSKL